MRETIYDQGLRVKKVDQINFVRNVILLILE